MNRRSALIAALLVSASTLTGCAKGTMGGGGWVTLFDGNSLDNWRPIGDANWRLEGGSVVADKGTGFLVSKNAYANFQIKAEFWVDDAANSGIFIRSTDAGKITAKNAYEVNVFDQCPDPSYGTGAIVDVAKAAVVLKAGGHWNTYEITAQGAEFTVTLNGVRTVDRVRDTQHARGFIGLQYAGGVVKFRKLEIREI